MLIMRVYSQLEPVRIICKFWRIYAVLTQGLKKKHVYNHDTTLFQHHHVKNVGNLTLSNAKKGVDI